jgi:hypothetical protein
MHIQNIMGLNQSSQANQQQYTQKKYFAEQANHTKRKQCL